MQDKQTKHTDFNTLKRIVALALPFKKIVLFSVFFAISTAIITAARPFFIQKIIDINIIKLNGKGLNSAVFILFLLILSEFLLKYFFGVTTTTLGQNVLLNLRTKLFNHVQTMQFKFFDKTPVGIITTRTINDIEAINNIFSEGLISIIADVLTLLFVILFMLYTNWKLALVCLTTFPLILFSTYIFKEKVRVSFDEVREKIAQLNAFVQEHISGIRTIQLFNAQEKEFKKFEQLQKQRGSTTIISLPLKKEEGIV